MPKLLSPDAELVTMRTYGICRKCKVKHELGGINPTIFGQAAFDWQHRHAECERESPGSIEFVTDRRNIPKGFDDRIYNAAGIGPQWLDWQSNANITIVYLADAAITMDLSALASSSTFVAGRESSSITNSSNYLDCKISGRFYSGTSPTAPGETRLYAVEQCEDTPTWPDVFDGTDSAETVSNTNILDSLPLLWTGTVSTSSNILYPVIGALTMAQCFGVMPQAFVLFFTHYHTAALKTDAGNTNSFYRQFIQAAVA